MDRVLSNRQRKKFKTVIFDIPLRCFNEIQYIVCLNTILRNWKNSTMLIKIWKSNQEFKIYSFKRLRLGCVYFQFKLQILQIGLKALISLGFITDLNHILKKYFYQAIISKKKNFRVKKNPFVRFNAKFQKLKNWIF